jgi:hypothetical protein
MDRRLAGDLALIQFTRRFALMIAPLLMAAPSLAMTPEEPTARIGGYFLMKYAKPDSTLKSADLVSALGATAGFFAQLRARELLKTPAWQAHQGAWADVETRDGAHYFFGDAINVGLYGSSTDGPGLWNYIAPAAGDPDIERKIDLREIAAHTAATVGDATFGVPRTPPAYAPSEPPLTALKRDAPVLLAEMQRLKAPANQYVTLFGGAAQKLVPFVAGQRSFKVDTKLPPFEAVRLFMETAVPMSKIDPAAIGVTV